MDTQRRAPRTFPLAVLGATACGVGLAVQSRVNGQLGAELGDGYLAALLSFSVGLAVLLLLTLFLRSGRQGVQRLVAAVKGREIPWWYLAGGAAGAFFVVTQGVAAAPLGIALYSIGIVCGQTVSGVIIDRIGLGAHAPRPITAQRLIGAVLALVAVSVGASSQFVPGAAPLLLILPFAAGLVSSWQQATNGEVRRASGSVFAATLSNFIVGALVLLVVVLVHSAIVGWPTKLPSDPMLYTGGLIGIIFIAISAAVVGIVGVLLLTLATIGGQLLMSLILDLVLPVSAHPVQWTTVLGTAIALVAVVIVATAKTQSAKQ